MGTSSSIASSFLVALPPHKAAFSVESYPLCHSSLLDCGTTLHVFNQLSRFKNFTTAEEGDFLWAGQDKVPILGYGEVDIRIRTPRQPRVLRLTDVAFCENFAANLVSYKELRKQGMWWDDDPSSPSCLRAADRSIVGLVDQHHGQFLLEYIPQDLTRRAFFARRNTFTSHTQRKPQRATAELWHRRLGHPGPRALEHLVNCSRGARIRGITTAECNDCGTAKAKEKIRREPREPADIRPGERIAIDFHDYEPDYKGYNSMMLLTDRASGFSWDYYLQDRRSETIVSTLNSAFKYLSYQLNFVIKAVECDNELTDRKHDVQRWLEGQQIRVEPSAPYTQSQNGGAERSGGVIKEKARAMTGKLPHQLWREICKAAVYLNNRTPKYRHKWRSPYEAVTGRKPGQEHLRAYGCKVFALTPDAREKRQRLKKLDPRAWIGYLVGYTSTNIYRVWVPSKAKVISTRDVIFDEDELFDGTYESLAESVKEANLEELAAALQRISLPEDDVVGPAAAPQPYDDEIFDLEDTDREGQQEALPEPKYTEARFELLPTPPPTPPAALLAAAIQSSLPLTQKAAAYHVRDPYESQGRDTLLGTRNGIEGREFPLPKQEERRRGREFPPSRQEDGIAGREFPLPKQEERRRGREFPPSRQEDGIAGREFPLPKQEERRRGREFPPSRQEDGIAGREFPLPKQEERRRGREFPPSRQEDGIAGREFPLPKQEERRRGREFPPSRQEDGIAGREFPLPKQEERRRGREFPPSRQEDGIAGREFPLPKQEERRRGREFPPSRQEDGIAGREFPLPKQEERRRGREFPPSRQEDGIAGREFPLPKQEERRRGREFPPSRQEDGIAGREFPLPKQEERRRGREFPPSRQEDGIAGREFPLPKQEERRRGREFPPSRQEDGIGLKAGLAHERAADRALSYLARTRGLALRLGGGDDFEVASDASFADDSTDRKSSQAFAMKLFDGLIGWRAGKQDTVTTSTTEAELLALSQAAKESLYVSRLIKELDVVLDRGCISIQCDNRQTIRLVTAEVATLQTKLRHIDVHNHWLRQEVANNTLGVTYTPTAEIMADGLTKALQGSMFRTFVERMGLEDITDRLAARELPETTDSMLQEQIYEAWEEQEV
ncbi:hypothetical protein HIM_03072 [Hirsutella minnesotensis 3608]|nr:hypothetical protein HIM_03072 [Hirsutella minnesotensis 3608]